jgi:hypothetical protein
VSERLATTIKAHTGPDEPDTDSLGMTTYLPKWLSNGFLTSSKTASQPVKNVELIKHLLVLIRRRPTSAPVKFKWVAGHSGSEGNEGADVSGPLLACGYTVSREGGRGCVGIWAHRFFTLQVCK